MLGPSTSAWPQYAMAQVGIEARRFRERAAGLGVIEAVGQVHTLVDELLRAGRAGGHLEGVRAQLCRPRREHASGARLGR